MEDVKMGTGIGIDCEICGAQLNYDDGFDPEKQICNECIRTMKRFRYFFMPFFTDGTDVLPFSFR
jgi:hypothetical protein